MFIYHDYGAYAVDSGTDGTVQHTEQWNMEQWNHETFASQWMGNETAEQWTVEQWGKAKMLTSITHRHHNCVALFETWNQLCNPET